MASLSTNPTPCSLATEFGEWYICGNDPCVCSSTIRLSPGFFSECFVRCHAPCICYSSKNLSAPGPGFVGECNSASWNMRIEQMVAAC
jgi:hypothetical protein